MATKIFWAFFSLTIVLGGAATGQTITVSPYSVYGIGILKDKGSALNRSLGGTGIGIRDPQSLNNLNPAAYTSMVNGTQITEIGLYVESGKYSTNSATNKFSSGNLTGLSLWFRFSKKWAGTAGLAPFSNVSYNVASSKTIGVDGSSTVKYSGNGGVSQFYIGNAFQLTKNLSIGANVAYVFGQIEKNEVINSGLGSGTILTDHIYVHQLNADFGAQYTFFLKKDRALSFGATFVNGLRLNTSGSRSVLSSSLGDTLYYNKTPLTDYTLPTQFGSGVAFQSNRSTIAFDFTYKQWSKANVGDDVKLRDTRRVSFGYEYKGKNEIKTYFDVIRLRIGGYMQENYLVLGQNSFSDYGMTLGAGLPVNGNRGMLNISYNFNYSGTTANNLIQQQAGVFVLDFTFRDLWGIKRKYD